MLNLKVDLIVRVKESYFFTFFRQHVWELYVLQKHPGGAQCHLHPCVLPHDWGGSPQ